MNRRPRIQLLTALTPTASASEAAAIVASLERFMRDTAAARHPAPTAPSAWARAAMLEATGHDPGAAPSPWGTQGS